MQAIENRETAAASHWKLTLSYRGSGFHGWQIQPGLATVQGTLAQALAKITGLRVLPQGSGRTDAGVHALAQVASFSLPISLPPASLQRALNRTLPPDLRVLAAEIVPPGFHARHSALRKHYEYRIFERRLPECPYSEHQAPVSRFSAPPTDRICSPFLAPFVWDCRWPLDIDRLQKAAELLLGTQDFTAMAATRRELSQRLGQPAPAPDADDRNAPGAPNPVKTIYSASWHRSDDLLSFNICGSGFLHHMVRNLVGTMVEIGRGRLDVGDLAAILASKKRSEAGPTAPASGLYLRAVEYEPADASAQPGNQAAIGTELAEVEMEACF